MFLPFTTLQLYGQYVIAWSLFCDPLKILQRHSFWPVENCFMFLILSYDCLVTHKMVEGKGLGWVEEQYDFVTWPFSTSPHPFPAKALIPIALSVMLIWLHGKRKVINRSVGGLFICFNYIFPAKPLNFSWIYAVASPHSVFVLYKGGSGGSISRQSAPPSDRSPLDPAPVVACGLGLTWEEALC